MNRVLAFSIVSLLALLPGAVAAQESNFVPSPSADQLAPPGWSFTPALAVGSGWDDNALVRGTGDDAPGDLLSVFDTRAALDYNGSRGQVSANYDGAFVIYRDLNQLNSFDQRASFAGRRLLTKHIAFFARNSFAAVPTTELAQLVAVPFVRTGSRLEDLRTGVEASFTKYTSATFSYDFQWVDFDPIGPGNNALFGGHSHGAAVTLKHLLSARLAVTGDYSLQHATLRDGELFNIENASAGLEYRLSEQTRFFAAGGISRLGATQFSANQTAPAWRVGLVRSLRRAGVDLLYSRSFVPSYGFGGTMQNEELTGRLRLPLGRRVYTTSALSWRRDDPLVSGELPLRTYWLEGTIGYAATRWIRVEGFYAATHQKIERPGGVLDRNRVGFQVITAKPLRIR
jgi:uncharacterized protein (PEP-CTERM system associated)